MSPVLSAILGLMFAGGTYLILSRDAVQVVIGSLVLSQCANLYIMIAGGKDGEAPIVGHHGAANVTDPVPQALVLTAIVIGFATTAFLLTLVYRFYEENEEVDLEKLGGEKS